MTSILGTSLSSPAPTSGKISKGSIPATNVVSRKRGLPTVSSMLNPSISTSVTDLQTNSTAAAPLFCRPFSREWEKEYSEGDILFVKREDLGMGNGNRPNARNITMNVVANLPVMNYILRTTTEEDGSLKYNTIEKIQNEWGFFGVMLNDMDTGSTFQRLLNVTVRGRCRAPMYWPVGGVGGAWGNNSATKGTIVWLGYKRVQATKSYSIATPAKNGLDQVQSGEIFYELTPVLENSVEWGEMARQDGGSYFFPVGVIHQIPHQSQSKKRQYRAKHVSEEGKLLDRMEIFIRV